MDTDPSNASRAKPNHASRAHSNTNPNINPGPNPNTNPGPDHNPGMARLFAGVRPTKDTDGVSPVPEIAPELAKPWSGDPDVPPSLPYEGVNDHGVVIADIRCRGCGYELRGLAMREACPECQWPVTRSVSGALLVHSPSSHVRRLRLGTSLVIASTLGAFLAAFLGGILALVLTWTTTWADAKTLELLGGGFGAASSVAALSGWWLLSTPDPALAQSEQPSAARRVLRALTVLSLVASVLSLVFQSLNITGVLPPGPPITIRLFDAPIALGNATTAAIDAFSIFGGLISLALTSAAMAYLAKIARRIPSPRLETSARRLVWLVWALQPLIGIGSLIAVIMVLISMMRARDALSMVLAQQRILAPADA